MYMLLQEISKKLHYHVDYFYPGHGYWCNPQAPIFSENNSDRYDTIVTTVLQVLQQQLDLPGDKIKSLEGILLDEHCKREYRSSLSFLQLVVVCHQLTQGEWQEDQCQTVLAEKVEKLLALFSEDSKADDSLAKAFEWIFTQPHQATQMSENMHQVIPVFLSNIVIRGYSKALLCLFNQGLSMIS